MGLCKDGYWRESEYYEGKKYIGCGKGQKEALKSLATKIADAKAGNTVLNKNTTVSKWADEWLETYIKHSKITDKTYAMYDQKIRLHIKSAIGSLKLKDVTEAHLQKILNRQEGMSASHAKKLRMIMKQMFYRATKTHIIPFNPAEDLELPSVTEGKRRSVTKIERAAILKIAKTHRAGPWIQTMLYCGPRPGELVPLQWKDIDFKAKTITISTALESGKSDEFKPPKTPAGKRTVPMPDALAEVLKSKAGGPFEYVFTQTRNKGKHLTESSFRKSWLSFKRELDIELGAEVKDGVIVKSVVADDLAPYNLRHTYCTDLETAGVPLNVAKVLMGHDDVTVTANIYTHQSQDVINSAAKKINKQAKKDKAG